VKRTYISAILIAITANSASAQQTFSVPYQVVQPRPVSGYASQSQVQQACPQASPHVIHGHHPVTQAQTVIQPVVPAATASILPAPTPATVPARVVQQSVVPQSSQVVSAKRAPAPAPSIPPQPEDLLVPAPSQVVSVKRAPAPAPSIPPQPEAPTAIVAQPNQKPETGELETSVPQDLAVAEPVVVPSTTSTLVPSGVTDSNDVASTAAPSTSALAGRIEPARPIEKSIVKPLETPTEIAAVENVKSIVESAKEVVGPQETAVAAVDNREEVELVVESQSGGLTGELVAGPALERERSCGAIRIGGVRN